MTEPTPAATEPGLPRPVRLQRYLIVAFAYGLVTWACAAGPTTPMLPWLPAGVAFVALLRWGSWCWPGIVLGGAVLALGPNAARSIAFAGGDLVGAVTAVWLLRRAGIAPALDRRADVGLLVLGLMVALAVGSAGTLALQAAIGAWSSASNAGPAASIAIRTRGLGLLLGVLAGAALGAEGWRRAFAPAVRKLNAGLLGALGGATLLLALLPVAAGAAPAFAVLASALLAALVVTARLAVAGPVTVVAALIPAWAGALGVGALATPAGAELYMLGLGLVALLVHAATLDVVGIERRWLAALGGAGLGVAEWHVGRDKGRTSARWRELCGDHDSSLAGWLARVHDDDRPTLRAALEALAEGRQARVPCELRIRAGDGWRWLDAQWLAAERDRHGRATRLLATLSDGSARHDAEQRQRLSASLFQHVQEGLLIADADLRVLDANPAFEQILGMPREELIGTVPSLLRPTPADPLARQQRLLMWSSLRSTGRWRGEIVERRRDGQPCTLQVTASTVPGEDGRVRSHLLVISDVTEVRQQRDRLERQVHFDELTRLPNRTHMMELLTQAMHAADQDGYLLAVCYLDLDRFKPVNDRFGHAAGDRLLVELAGRLRGALRSSEVWSDAAGRIGGDEFLLLLRAGSIDEVRLAIERVLRVLAQPYVVDPGVDAVQITASMGATIYPIDRSDADTLMRHADHAMYGAKQAGRNGYQLFDPENRRRNEERVMAIGRVQEALDNGEFVLHYQPKVDMRRGVVLGLEALLRWDHPQQGLVAPAQFLPLIEHTGLSARIGDWVLSQALEHLAGWRRAGLELSVSVNVSARHLQEPDFALRLAELLARHADQPLAAALELEILETAAHADIQSTSAKLVQCRALGVRFALDDFGTGYSTLTYLKQLPVDVLKIDRSFVHHMLDDSQDRAIVEGVIGLARTFQCTVVAEGVESPAQARTLLELGCHIGQGTGIAAPMPASAVAAWVRDYRGLFALSAAAAPARSTVAGGE
jgi:diguanylate cyclase (GGDEF)-like protein/PAS domain S-box-containing protein